MKISNMAVLAAALMASAAASASEANFNSLDKDGNGLISTSEASQLPVLAEEFKNLDTDQDGQLSESEFANFGK
ncbi:EF-hand domain-containing protein [Pseudoalteromonas xiamenensis]|jgi:Ca2+-binding EF-hand superfamily protein